MIMFMIVTIIIKIVVLYSIVFFGTIQHFLFHGSPSVSSSSRAFFEGQR